MRSLTICALALVCMQNFAHAAFDLSGVWDMSVTVTEDDVPYKTQLTFIPTPFTTNYGGKLYMAHGDLDGWKLWGASIENLDGEEHIAWWGEKYDGFDAESNMILKASADELSLGGDFERYEVAKMFRVSSGE